MTSVLLETLRVGLGVGAGLLVVACSTAPKPNVGNSEAVSLFLSRSFTDIRLRPLKEPTDSQLALAGLRNLAELDSRLVVVQSNGSSAVSLESQAIYRFRNPRPMATSEWARVTAEALIAAYERSELLQAQELPSLYDAFMRGTVPLLGDGAAYLTSKENSWLADWQDARIDIFYQSHEHGVEVTEFGPDAGIEADSLKLSDIITHVDGVTTAGRGGLWRLYTERLFSGQPQSVATLTVSRTGIAEPINIPVKRMGAPREPWALHVREGFVELKAWHIGPAATQRVLEVLSASTRSKQHFKGAIIDLRSGNKRPWSRDFITAAFAETLAAAFLGEGMIVAKKLGRPDGFNIRSKSNGKDIAEGMPLVILVDGSTAGSSELFAAALQDHGRALVVGTTSVGFGTLSTSVEMPHGGLLEIPAMYVFAPSGYSIEGRGITPNVCTSNPGSTRDGLLTLLRQGEGLTSEEARKRNIAPNDSVGVSKHRALCPPEPDSGDLPYELGLAILEDPNLYARLIASGGPS